MSWIDRINRYFLDAVARRHAGANISGPTLTPMTPALVHHLARLDLASHDEFVGETWVLWGTLLDGTPTAISETDPGWHVMRAALDQSGRLSIALHLAELQLLADPNRKPVCLIGDNESVLTKPSVA